MYVIKSKCDSIAGKALYRNDYREHALLAWCGDAKAASCKSLKISWRSSSMQLIWNLAVYISIVASGDDSECPARRRLIAHASNHASLAKKRSEIESRKASSTCMKRHSDSLSESRISLIIGYQNWQFGIVLRERRQSAMWKAAFRLVK